VRIEKAGKGAVVFAWYFVFMGQLPNLNKKLFP
jgi:hypothetical protein